MINEFFWLKLKISPLLPYFPLYVHFLPDGILGTFEYL